MKIISAKLVRDLLEAYGNITKKSGCDIRIEFSIGNPTPSTITYIVIC